MSFEFFPEESDRIAANATPLMPEDVEAPAFAGLGGELLRAPMRAFSSMGAAGALAVSGALRTHGIDQADETLFGVVDRFRQARDFWTAEPGEVGTAGRILGGLTEFGTLLGVGAGNPALAIGTTELNTAADLAVDNVSPGVAVTAGAVEAAGTAVAFRVPFLGKTLAQRLVLGAGANVAAGAATTGGVNLTLSGAGYDVQAERYDPWNVEARAVDAFTGALFGGIAHYAERATPQAREAAAVLNDHQHATTATAPGIPKTPEAIDAHVDAIRQAIGELGSDQPVTAAVDPALFKPDPYRTAVNEEVRTAAREEFGPEPRVEVDPPLPVDQPPPMLPDPPVDAAPQFKLPPGLDDGRLADPVFRNGLGALANEIEKGGGVSYIYNERGDITGRSPSVNPPWFQQLAKDERVSVAEVKAAVDAALEGRRLGAKQARVVSRMLGEVEDREGVLGPQFLNRTATEVDAEARRADMRLEERAYLPEWDTETRDLMDIAAAARRMDAEAVDAILESQADDAQIAQRLQEVIDRGRQSEGRAPQAEGVGSARPAAGAPVGAEAGKAGDTARTDAAGALELSSAAQILRQSPDLMIALEDGTTVRAADALAAAEADVRQAEELGAGVNALATCALQFLGG